MKVKLFHLFYITLFVAACLLPFMGMAVFGPSQAGTAEAPVLFHEDGSFNWEVLDDTEQYLAEHFALRQEFLTVWAHLHATFLNTSVEEQVILGEDHWLYEAATADDYMGVTMEEAELSYAAHNLYLMQEYAQSRGARFLFAIAPNKNSLYPENMPEHYPVGTASNASLLMEQLTEWGVNHVDLFTVFRQETEVLYYRTDSRWNGRGAALAADTILQQLQKSTGYFDGEFVSKGAHTGDLYALLYPAGLAVEPATSYAAGFTFTYSEAPDGGDITTAQTGVRDRLLCWMDTFGSELYSYLAEVYETAQFSEEAAYDLTEIGRQNANAVVIELAERDLQRLVEYAPVMPAPERRVSPGAFGQETLSGAVGETSGDLTQLTVTVPRSLTDGGSLYVKVNDTVYEGCVICGDDALICSAYVSGEIPKVVELITRTQGVYTTYSCVLGA